MKFKKIFFIIAIIGFTVSSVFAVNNLLKGGKSGIKDIGTKVKTNYLEVPMTLIYYPVQMQFVNNILIYSNRIKTIANCLIDKFGAAGCPLDQGECEGSLEYTTGSSSIGGIGNISCSTIDPLSYFDSVRNKCVLPASKSKVCDKNIYYKYQAPLVDNDIKSVWQWKTVADITKPSNDTSGFLYKIMPVIQAAGGNSATVVKISSYEYKFSINTTKTFYIQVATNASGTPSGKIIIVKPGEYFYYNSIYNYILDNTKTTTTSNSHPYLLAWTEVQSYQCKSGEQMVQENGINICTTSTPINVSGTYNPATDKCMTNYQYSAPSHPETITKSWSWCDSCWDDHKSGLAQEILPVIEVAGGTFCNLKSNGTYAMPSQPQITNTKYLFETNTKKTIHIKVGSVSINYSPGDVLELIEFGNGEPGLIYNNTYYGSGQDKPDFIASVDYDVYTCNNGETLIANGGSPICDAQIDYNPGCTNSTFSERSHDECVTDVLHYQWYNYQCPTETNQFGSLWHPLNGGGDCGGGKSGIDINGDGIKDYCNASTPPKNNCYRTNYKCPSNPNNPCVFVEKDMDYNDFNKWHIVNLSGNATDSKWNVANNSIVTQTNDTPPSFFISDYAVQDNGKITITGQIQTSNTTDNDWMGIVFGYKDINNFYLIDWSKKPNDLYNSQDINGKYYNRDASGNPLNGAIPLTLSKINSNTNITSLWAHINDSTMSILQRKDNGGWKANQKYNIRIEIDPNNIKAWIGKEGESMNLDIDYHSAQVIDFTGKIGFYNYSLSNTSYSNFQIEWENGETITTSTKEPLSDMGQFVGSFKGDEYGNEIITRCASDDGICRQALSSIIADDKKISFVDMQGVSGDVNFNGQCTFEGRIAKDSIDNKLLFSILNSPDEAVNDTRFSKDYNSPTRVSLNFEDMPGYLYPLKQVKTSASKGDQITVTFWLNWRGDATNMTADVPIGFHMYSLYLSYIQNIAGFSSGNNDVYGISNANTAIGNSGNWAKVTAIFTHQDMALNKLYVNGVEQGLSEQIPNSTHNNMNADITKILNLGGTENNGDYAINAKIAGVNVYDGALSNKEIMLDYSGGNRGINRLEIDKNKIIGYDSDGNNLGTITSSCLLQGKVGYHEDGGTSQIVAAKAINGRLEFWDSFNVRGNIGFIEAIKIVDPKNAADGYLHEYSSFRELYDKGFTGFKSSGGNTYAVSSVPMGIDTCLSSIEGTGYFIAERVSDDLDGTKIINSLSYYTSGDYKDHCIIEKHKAEDNIASQYAVKTTYSQKVKGHFACSPYGCKDYKCGYASCAEGSLGTNIKDADKAAMPADTCYDQKCDMSKNYFQYCGNPYGCNTKDPTVMATTDGKCQQATCPKGGVYNPKLKACEKMGCKYEEKDNKCYKKVY